MFLSVRSSNWFITSTIAVAVFTDIFLYAVVVPVIPFALHTKANIAEDRVQYWVSVLVAIYGAGAVLASRLFLSIHQLGMRLTRHSNLRLVC